MNRTQLEHIIRAASKISGDSEIVVIGSQAIHAQDVKTLPPIVFQSEEADAYPRNHPERADDIDAAIGELSPFHETHGYYAQGASPETAKLPEGWERRLIRLSSPNTGGAPAFAWMCTILCFPNMLRAVRRTGSLIKLWCGTGALARKSF